MPLEKLLDQKINIADLHSKRERTESEAGKLFGKLKETPLYDEQKNWNFGMYKEHSFSGHSLRDQLFGLMIEGMLGEKDKNEVLARRESLNQLFPSQTVICQLLGVWIEGRFGDPKKARNQYEDIKKKKELYDEERGMWMENKEFNSRDQLIGVLIEGILFNKKEARNHYESLKKTFFNENVMLWRKNMREDEAGALDAFPEIFSTQDQLLGILLEGTLFSKEEAGRHCEGLKKNEILYDKEKALWKADLQRYFAGNLTSSENYYSEAQLAGVLVEIMLEEKHFSPEKRKPVPEMKGF